MDMLTRVELTNNIQDIVLDNPNHVKEYLFNCGMSAMLQVELISELRASHCFPEDIIFSLCERGVV